MRIIQCITHHCRFKHVTMSVTMSISVNLSAVEAFSPARCNNLWISRPCYLPRSIYFLGSCQCWGVPCAYIINMPKTSLGRGVNLLLVFVFLNEKGHWCWKMSDDSNLHHDTSQLSVNGWYSCLLIKYWEILMSPWLPGNPSQANCQ